MSLPAQNVISPLAPSIDAGSMTLTPSTRRAVAPASCRRRLPLAAGVVVAATGGEQERHDEQREPARRIGHRGLLPKGWGVGLPGRAALKRPAQRSSSPRRPCARRRAPPSTRPRARARARIAGVGRARAPRRAAACAGRAAAAAGAPRAPAQSARAAFSAMSPPAGQTTTGQPHDSARTSVPWPPWVTTRSQPGIVRAYDSQGTSTALAGTATGGSGARPLYVAITRTGARARARPARRAAARCSGSCAVDGRDQHDRAVAGRRRDPLTRRLPQQRPDDPQPRLPAARVLELRQRAHERQRAREPRVDARQRRQARAARGIRCTRAAPARGPAATAVEAPPDPRTGAGARQPGAERVGREAGRRPRVHVGNQRRHRHVAQLGGERRRRGEDVRRPRCRARTPARTARSRGRRGTAASYGCSGRSRVGKTWYSGAAANVIPAASAGSSQRRQVCSATA